MDTDKKKAKKLKDDSDEDYTRDLEKYESQEDDLEGGAMAEDPVGGAMAGYRRVQPPHSGHRIFVMYHGTTKVNAQKIQANGFNRSVDGMLGPGVYLSRNFVKAAKYPLKRNRLKCVVLKVKVRVGKVKRIDRQGHPLQKTWHQHGYDTAWVPPNCGMVPSGLEEDCVYDPNRIQVLEVIPN